MASWAFQNRGFTHCPIGCWAFSPLMITCATAFWCTGSWISPLYLWDHLMHFHQTKTFGQKIWKETFQLYCGISDTPYATDGTFYSLQYRVLQICVLFQLNLTNCVWNPATELYYLSCHFCRSSSFQSHVASNFYDIWAKTKLSSFPWSFSLCTVERTSNISTPVSNLHYKNGVMTVVWKSSFNRGLVPPPP